MVYRFFVAIAFSVVVFPFAAMYTFAVTFPDATFSFDRQTWLYGLAVIGFGWALFLLPGLLPFVGHRYYDWVARKTGLVALFDGLRSGFTSLRERTVAAGSAIRGAGSNLSALKKYSFLPRRSAVARGAGDPTPGTDADSPPLDPQPDTAETTVSSPQDVRRRASEGIGKVRNVLNDAPKHIDKAKETLNTLRMKITPDELQHTIDLNQYTLEVFSHLKTLVSSFLASASLGKEDLAFVQSVFGAVPEPPSPTDADRLPEAQSFDYPEARRPDLKNAAARVKVTLRDTDFELAADGDIERALFIAKALVLIALPAASDKGPAIDDPMVGLG
jgi:hypothetical protein